MPCLKDYYGNLNHRNVTLGLESVLSGFHKQKKNIELCQKAVVTKTLTA